jgi:hypothetical protein
LAFEFRDALLVAVRVLVCIAVVLHFGDLIVQAIDLILQPIDLLAVGRDDAAQIRLGIRLLIIRREHASTKCERTDQQQRQKNPLERTSVAPAIKAASTHCETAK